MSARPPTGCGCTTRTSPDSRSASPGVQVLEMHYPLIHHSNQRPYHFIHGYAQFLEEQLGVRVPVTRFHGEVYLSDEEKHVSLPAEWGLPTHFWIIVAGGKHDFTAKWWNPAELPGGRGPFPRTNPVRAMRGRRALASAAARRDELGGPDQPAGVRAADVPRRRRSLPGHARHALGGGRRDANAAARHAACVVIAGGREPAHWEAYPNHQFLSTNGTLSCCLQGGCWKSRCQLVGDGDPKDTPRSVRAARANLARPADSAVLAHDHAGGRDPPSRTVLRRWGHVVREATWPRLSVDSAPVHVAESLRNAGSRLSERPGLREHTPGAG